MLLRRLLLISLLGLLGCGGDGGGARIGGDGGLDLAADAPGPGPDTEVVSSDTLADAQDSKTGADTLPTDGGQDSLDVADGQDSDTVTPPSPWPPADMEELAGASPFFIDHYEWPNQAGQVPLGFVASKEAAASICAAVNKRLCSPAELALACAPSGTSYPYGNQYSPNACNTELPYLTDPCGANAACHAPGTEVFDLVGNVAEWASDGTLFGGSVADGLQGNCGRFVTPPPEADATLFGLRCCLAAQDDLDHDGSPASLDCHDGDAAILPGATEACNGLDDDCNGLVDDTPDLDQDGFNTCTDCNDSAFSIHPGATDNPGDKVDADCDGEDGSDNDRDGYLVGQGPGLDCNDQDGTIHPGAVELCNGLDDDCDGQLDAPLALGACDDGNPCTDDLCDQATDNCQHLPAACDDDNPCTLDSCDPSLGCQASPQAGPCDDGEPCTLQDACLEGLCVGMANPCNDDNPCTTDSCEAATGACLHDATPGPCNDGNPCSTGDACLDGQCKAGPGTLDCSDGNACTNDDCTEGQGCLHEAMPGPCDDGDPCTGDDSCVEGVCTGGSNLCACNDDDACLPLNDANWCNGYLHCATRDGASFCETVPGSVVNCNNAQESFCQAKVCDPLDGVCKLKPRNEGEPCDSPCTANPTCQNGQCKGTACSALSQSCAGGQCISNSCTPNASICDGDFATMTCDADGNGWSASSPCGPGRYCEQGQCKPQVCPPDSVSCVGRLAGTCDNRGAGLLPGFTDCEPKAATPYCVGGHCASCSPNCDGRQCGPDTCGGSCGTCAPGSDCQPDGTCRRDCTVLEAVVLGLGNNACVLTAAGNISCFGQDSLGNTVEAIGPYSRVSTGIVNTCAIKPGGQVQCWGHPTVVDTTPGNQTFKEISVGGVYDYNYQSASPFACGITLAGAIQCWGSDNFDGLKSPKTGSYQRLDCAGVNCCAISTEQALVCWGRGAMAVPQGSFKAVSVGSYSGLGGHACALDLEGKPRCFGNNDFGQLNVPNNLVLAAVSAGNMHFCGLLADGSIKCWGNNGAGQLEAPQGQFQTLDAGLGSTCALDLNGNLKCWGGSLFANGGLPLGAFTKAEVGYESMCALRANGTGLCDTSTTLPQAYSGLTDISAGGYGWNGSSTVQLCGLSTQGLPICSYFIDTKAATPLPFPGPDPLKAISADGHHVCGITSKDLLQCWGASPHHDAPANTKASLVSASYWFDCALKSDGSPSCWGSVEAATAHPPAGTYTHLASFSYSNNGMAAYTCAVRADTSGACWGGPNFGQLAVPQGPWKMIIPSTLFACGLRPSGELLCWGNHPFGDYFSGRYTSFDLDRERLCAITTAGDTVCQLSNIERQVLRADTCVN